MWPRLVSNSWAQAVLSHCLPKVLGSKARATGPGWSMFFGLFFEMKSCAAPRLGAEAQSQLTAISTSRVQVILMLQPLESLGLQAPTTMPG